MSAARPAPLLLAAAFLIALPMIGWCGLVLWRHHRAGIAAGSALVGRAAPDFRLPRVDGAAGEAGLADFRGRPVLVEFFATWCPPCQRIGTTVAEFAARYADEGLAAIGVSFDATDTLAKVPDYVAAHHVGFPVVGDGRGHQGPVKDAYDARSIPHLVLIDADGRVVSANLAGATPDETLRNLQLAVLPRLHRR